MSRLRAAVFCLLVVLPCVAVIFAVPFAVRSHWFATGRETHWVPVRDYPYDVHGADADVVVFGDSSALAGIDPLLMQPALGLRVVNLSPILKSLSMMQDAPLAAYVAHNKAPRLIVVYLAAWNTGMPPDEASPDGLIVMMRHGTVAQGMAWAMRHPVQMLNADIFIGTLVLGRIGHQNYADSGKAVALAQGFFPYPGQLPHLQAGCRFGSDDVVPPDPGAWARRITDRYQNTHTRVVLYLAPLPACTGGAALAAQQRQLTPQAINQLVFLDPQIFLDDSYYAHPEERNAPITTQMLTDALRPLPEVESATR